VLTIFGFDRTLYGKPRNKKWWEEIRKNQLRDAKAGTIAIISGIYLKIHKVTPQSDV
jgi:hypothetical protein